MASYRVISSDDHVFEPADMWTSRAESRFKDQAPHVVRKDDGSDWWVCGDHKVGHMGGGAQAGRRFEEPEKLSIRDVYENVRPGGYEPDAHVKDMDIDGVDVSILYPTITLNLYRIPDSQVLSAMFGIYNDWIAEFCRTYPERLKGIAILNLDDVQEGIGEMERCAKMGLSGAMISVYPPEGRGYFTLEYERLFATAQDLGMPLALHIGTNRPGPGQQFTNDLNMRPAFEANVDHWVRMSLGDMIYSGVFERYPKLHVGSIEMELSWVPHFLERMDYCYTQRAQDRGGYWRKLEEGMLPSDYFHRNAFLGFQEDGLGVRLRDIIGVDNLLWGSDYPHPESTFPRSRQILEEILDGCTEEEKAKIAGGNAARIYHLD